jgi:hypothetical protein
VVIMVFITGNLIMPCENLCEKNFPKSARISKNWKKCEKLNPMISISYNKLRRLGNPEVLTTNP